MKVKKQNIALTFTDENRQIELRRGVSVTAPVLKHFHLHYQLCLITDGVGFLRHQRIEDATPAGTFFAIRPGVVHENECFEGGACSFKTINVSPSRSSGLSSEPGLGGVAVTSDSQVVSRFEQVFDTMSKQNGTCVAALDALMADVFDCMPASEPHKASDQVALARQYIEKWFARPIELGELARIAGLSRFHFVRRFSERYGMPPHHFQVQCKVARARELLLAGHSPGEAALSVGFADQSHLNRHFKRLTAVCPSKYKIALGRARFPV